MSAAKPLGEACILAGGLSTRMGQDKARLRLGGRTFLAHVRLAAQATGLPVRVIRKDAVPRSGPVGGIYTALRTTKAEAVLFLSCDMPFVTASLLRRLLARFGSRSQALFVWEKEAGFPYLIRTSAREEVTASLELGERSLQRLAARLRAQAYAPSPKERAELLNVNTPEDYAEAVRLWRERNQASRCTSTA